MICEVEGMTTYEDLVHETLKYNALPHVVPELKTITIGGAIVGIGLESSSFKYGLVHESIVEMEILLSDGRAVTCSPTNSFSDLFFAIPNSYGTLGYILKLKVKLLPVKKYVQLRHIRYNDATSFVEDVGRYCSKEGVDFVDGAVFSPKEHYLSVGSFVDEAPYISDYRYMNVYYKSMKERNTDYVATLQYVWRYDPDWFWCSRGFYLQIPFVRFLLGPFVLGSQRFMKIWRSYHKLGLHDKRKKEFVIQDVEIPLNNCVKFLDWFHKNIGIEPVWICPVKPTGTKYPIYPMQNTLYINFGFWDAVYAKKEDPSWHNKALERTVDELNGSKSLYSSSFFTEEDFWKKYNKSEYQKVKGKYDPTNSLLNLYSKCVGDQ